MRRSHAALLGLILLAANVVIPATARAATQKDPAAQRREVQRRRAEVAGRVNVLKASDAELGKALDALDANARATEAGAAGARQSAQAASKAAADAKVAEQRAAAELARIQGAVRQAAVAAYIHPSQSAMTDPGSSSLGDMVLRDQLVKVAFGQTGDLTDQLRALNEDMTARRAEADAAAAQARARQQEAERTADAANRAKAAKQKLADGVEARLEATLAEADSLAQVDKQLAAQIAARQAALAKRVAPSARPSRGGSRPGPRPGLTTVRGITVASSIASQLEGLLSAADGAGLNFGGTGYRSSDQQVATRRANCGSSDYDVYEKPASQCSPPTARPGQSMHEQGLAIDFTNNGRLIQSRSDPAFQWLRGNASRFGLSNLPSEPWHWSTNGN